jgi:hypothetical protein
MEDSLSNGTLDRWYARIVLLSKEWWSEEMVVLRLKCVDYVDSFFLWLTDLVPPSSVILFLGHCCLFGQVCLLWMTRRLQDSVLERKILLFILDYKIYLGTVCIDNGLRGAQERSAQNDGCPFIFTYFQNHKVYRNI